MCWKDEDRKRIVLCDGCNGEYHTYCIPGTSSGDPLEEDGKAHQNCPCKLYKIYQKALKASLHAYSLIYYSLLQSFTAF